MTRSSPSSSNPEPTAAGSTDAFLSSGQSPGRALHLIGPGHVGRAFLQQLPDDVRVLAVSDSTATVYARDGLPTIELVAHKQRGAPLCDWPGAERIPAELAIRMVSAPVVVDATSSGADGTAAAEARGQAALQSGAALALCGKNALARRAAEWLAPGTRARCGVNATLGGAGAQLAGELDELRAHCRSLALVGNATTTAIVEAVEGGASLDEGVDAARALGLLEPDATLDLDGSDAAVKLLCVWAAVFGERGVAPPQLPAVRREDVRALDVDALRERRRRGSTTRLVARADRAASSLRVAFEEVPIGSPLAAPSDRVVYGYELPRGLRVHTGLGVGYVRTAEALLRDVERLFAEVAR